MNAKTIKKVKTAPLRRVRTVPATQENVPAQPTMDHQFSILSFCDTVRDRVPAKFANRAFVAADTPNYLKFMSNDRPVLALENVLVYKSRFDKPQIVLSPDAASPLEELVDEYWSGEASEFFRTENGVYIPCLSSVSTPEKDWISAVGKRRYVDVTLELTGISVSRDSKKRLHFAIVEVITSNTVQPVETFEWEAEVEALKEEGEL